MTKQKLVLVAYAHGREGTSALMGLLNKCGIFTGVSYRDARNPKGFFEDPEHEDLLIEIFSNEIYPGKVEPPTLDTLQAKADAGLEKYQAYIQKVIENHEAMAIKCPRFLALPMAEKMQEKYDVKVIVTSREINSHVKSIQRMWQTSNDPAMANADTEHIKEWIYRWKAFGEKAVAHYSALAYHNTSFDQLMNDKYKSTQAICAFIGIPAPEQKVIEGWLDDKLVNRKEYKQTFFQKLKFKIENFFMKIKETRA